MNTAMFVLAIIYIFFVIVTGRLLSTGSDDAASAASLIAGFDGLALCVLAIVKFFI